MLIDAHTHLGSCRVFDLNVTEEQLLAAMDTHGVDAAIVQPFPGADDARATHDRIARLAAAHPGRVFGLANLNPHIPRRDYAAEVTRCVREMGFVGVKLHPMAHGVGPATRDAQTVFEVAQELDVPVMIHTGTGAPFALPALYLPIAHSYPQLRLVLAHAGFVVYAAEAGLVATECPNVYLETSWSTPQAIAGYLRTLPVGRVLFGSDLPVNVGVELAKVAASAPDPERRASFLGTAAAALFRLPRVAAAPGPAGEPA